MLQEKWGFHTWFVPDSTVKPLLQVFVLFMSILSVFLRCSFAIELCMNYTGLNVPSQIGNFTSCFLLRYDGVLL